MKRLGRPLGLFKNLADKIVFAIAAIIGLQIPNFIGQYRQRLGGHFDEASQNLKSYEGIAEETIGTTDLDALATHYQQGSSDVQIIGEKLVEDVARADRLGLLVENLEGASIFGRLKHLIVDLEMPVARATMSDYQPGLPITPEAIMYALIFGIIATLLFNWILFLFGTITNTYGEKRDHQGYKMRKRPDAQTKELLRGTREDSPAIFYEDSSEQHDRSLTPEAYVEMNQPVTKKKQQGYEQISENIRRNMLEDDS